MVEYRGLEYMLTNAAPTSCQVPGARCQVSGHRHIDIGPGITISTLRHVYVDFGAVAFTVLFQERE